MNSILTLGSKEIFLAQNQTVNVISPLKRLVILRANSAILWTICK